MDFENDSDWDMMELENAGDRAQQLKADGICTHGWTQGIGEKVKCLDCDKVFNSYEDLYAEIDEVMI